MDLLLTHGYFLYDDPKERQIMKPYPPLGILYLASHLRAKQFDVEIFDTTFSSWPEFQKVLTSTPPAVLGVYANLMTRTRVVRILGAAKEAGWKTVVGGPEPGAYIEEYLAAGADVVVAGEGEITLEELLPALKTSSCEQLERVSGIAFRGEDGRVRRTPPRAQIPDIDAQPWPSRESIAMDRYLDTWRQHHGAGSVSLITARGCPYDCRWCSHAVYGKTDVEMVAAGPVEKIVDPEAILVKAMAMEEDGIQFYNKAALECAANADSASKQIFEQLVKDEEGHFDLYEKQHDNIKRFGPSYLALQSFGGAAPESAPAAE